MPQKMQTTKLERALGWFFLIGGLVGLPIAYGVYNLWPNHG